LRRTVRLGTMEAAGPYYAFEQLPLGPDKPLKKAEGGGGRRPRSRWWWCCGSRKHESRFIRLNAKRPTLARFPHNRVVNTKYTVVSFVPKVLYEQFKYFFNLYFLLVALSQFFPPLQIGLLVTYVAPLVFVLAVTMTKEGYDDLKRWKTDREINRELYTRLLPGGATETIRAQDIKVGHLLRLQTNQRVPADMVLLRTSASSGVVFLRTDQLDGETDWKLRTAAPSCQKLNSDEAPRCRDTPEIAPRVHVPLAHRASTCQDLARASATVYAAQPSRAIYEFVGDLTLYDEAVEGGATQVHFSPFPTDSFITDSRPFTTPHDAETYPTGPTEPREHAVGEHRARVQLRGRCGRVHW